MTAEAPDMVVDDILARYKDEEFPPALDDADAQLVISALRERGMVPALGIRGSVREGQTATSVLLSHDLQSRSMLQRHPEAIVGPYVLGEAYHADGISIWRDDPTPQAQTPQSAAPEALAA